MGFRIDSLRIFYKDIIDDGKKMVIPKAIKITKTPTIATEIPNIDSSSNNGKEEIEEVKTIEKKGIFVDQGMGEYRFKVSLCIAHLPISCRGKPSKILHPRSH